MDRYEKRVSPSEVYKFYVPGTTMPQAGSRAERDRSPGWLHPIAMSQLQRAVRERKPTVLLGDTQFNIKYGRMLVWPTSGEVNECIWIEPVRDFIPCGYIPLKVIEEFEFEG